MTTDIECKKVGMKEAYLDDLVLRELKAKLKRVLDAEELKLNRSGVARRLRLMELILWKVLLVL